MEKEGRRFEREPPGPPPVFHGPALRRWANTENSDDDDDGNDDNDGEAMEVDDNEEDDDENMEVSEYLLFA